MEELIDICSRVQEFGIDSLSDEEKVNVFITAYNVGIPFEGYESLNQYCDDVIEQVGIQLSKELAWEPRELEIPPQEKKMAKKTPTAPKDCIFDDDDDVPSSEPCPEISDEGENLDPISMGAIEDKDLARIRCDGKLSCYDIKTLKSILDTDPRDPISRSKFSEEFQREILRRHQLADQQSRSSSSSDVEDGSDIEDELQIARALKQLDKLYDPVERAIEYSTTMDDTEKKEFNAEILHTKEYFKEFLRNPQMDVETKILIVFGNDEFPGQATEHEAQIRERVYNLTFE